MPTPDGDDVALGPRGQRLFDALTTGVADVATIVLAEEAARVADRLDDLERIIAGKGVLDLLRFRLVDQEGLVAEVKFDNVMAEARQQGSVLRQMLVTLGVGKGAADAGQPEQTRTAIDELNARRAEREARAAGKA